MGVECILVYNSIHMYTVTWYCWQLVWPGRESLYASFASAEAMTCWYILRLLQVCMLVIYHCLDWMSKAGAQSIQFVSGRSGSNCDQKHEHFKFLQFVWLCFHAFETPAVDGCLTLSTCLGLFESLNVRIKSAFTWDLTKWTEDETAPFSVYPRRCSEG